MSVLTRGALFGLLHEAANTRPAVQKVVTMEPGLEEGREDFLMHFTKA